MIQANNLCRPTYTSIFMEIAKFFINYYEMCIVFSFLNILTTSLVFLFSTIQDQDRPLYKRYSAFIFISNIHLKADLV